MINERPGVKRQRQLLEEEGVVFATEDKIDLKKYSWRGPDEADEPMPDLISYHYQWNFLMQQPSGQLQELPSDWWQTFGTSQLLSERFFHHVLALALSYSFNNKRFRAVFSGMLIDLDNRLFWVTAGHVIDDINKILSTTEIVVLDMRWLDRANVPNADSLIVHNRKLQTYSLLPSHDIGLCLLSGLDELHLRRNTNINIMAVKTSSEANALEPEGYVLAGFPKEQTNIQEQPFSNKQIKVALKVTLVCLPIRKIDRSDFPETSQEFWNDENAFYGEILKFSDGVEQPKDIKGMSGGPLFSLIRESDGAIRFSLEGIQSSWIASKRLIRAQSIDQVLTAVDTWLTKN